MKKVLLIGLVILSTGCATRARRATEFCDGGWSGRFNSWQDCYDRKMHESKPVKFFNTSSDLECTTIGNLTTCEKN